MADSFVTKVISTHFLAGLIRGVENATIAVIYTVTEPSLAKTGNPYWDRVEKCWLVRKRACTRVMIGGTYSGAVNTRRHKEWTEGSAPAAFQSSGRRWGERVRHTVAKPGRRASLVEYEGVKYLDVQRLTVLSVSYVDLAGNTIPASRLEPFMPQTKRDSKLQQLRNQVTWRDYRLTNVVQLRMNGIVFDVRRDSDAAQQPNLKAA